MISDKVEDLVRNEVKRTFNPEFLNRLDEIILFSAWQPTIQPKLECQVLQAAFAIAYAENECVETRFPANNPIAGVPELTVNNPMSPLNPYSFWSETIRPYCGRPALSSVSGLIEAVDQLFRLEPAV
jgi:hypothetical protein